MIWLPKIGRSEWILQPPEVVARKRVCSKHFSKEMISGTKLKKTAFPDIFEEGIGEKGIYEIKLRLNSLIYKIYYN